MTNAEKYKNEIRAIKNNAINKYIPVTFGITKDSAEIKSCEDMHDCGACVIGAGTSNCIFDNYDNIDCNIMMMEWLMSEYKPIHKTLTPTEKRFCDFLNYLFARIESIIALENKVTSEVGSVEFNFSNVYISKDRYNPTYPAVIELWYGKPYLTEDGIYSQFDNHMECRVYSLGNINNLNLDGIDFDGIENEACYRLVDVLQFKITEK